MYFMNWMGLRTVLCLAIGMAAPVSFGAMSGKPSEAQATEASAVMLDHNEFPCFNCLFGMADYYFCFAAGDKTLIGHERIRTQTRKKEPVELMERGKSVQIKYDAGFIWVPQAKGKDLRLTQDYTKKIFLNSDRCQAAVH